MPGPSGSPVSDVSLGGRAQGTTRGEELLSLPIGPLPRLALALCRPGPPLEAVELRDHWVLYRWSGESGASAEIALRTAEHPDHCDDDALAAQALLRARSHPKAQGELQALLVRLAERNGQDGQWRWGEVARVIYGPAAKSHHNGILRLWVALMERAHWRFGTQSPVADSHSPWGGRPLLVMERAEPADGCRAAEQASCRCSLTARVVAPFAQALERHRHRVPVEVLQLPQGNHTNPEGRRPSRATLLRIRTAALHEWHTADADPVASERAGARVVSTTLQELLDRAGIDVPAHIRRRHLGDLLSDVVAQLKATAAWVGVGLRQAPVRAGRLLSTVLRLEGPSRLVRPPSAAQRPPPRTATPPSRAASRPAPSRAPPGRAQNPAMS